MTDRILRIATRQSPLALWQAEHIKQQLQQAHPHLSCVLVPLQTSGDRFTQDSLSAHGGKGLFVKELERALIEDEADIAVHSMKDVPVLLPENLMLAAFIEREDPRDAFLSTDFANLEVLPLHAIVGTASLRRKALIKHLRPDLKVELLRGNVNTRLQKLANQEYDAIILAAAGLKRLGFEAQIKHLLEPDIFIPAINQGILGIECRSDDFEIIGLLQSINDPKTQLIANVERTINQGLGGACHIPVAGYAYFDETEASLASIDQTHRATKVMHILAMIGNPENGELLRSTLITTADKAIEAAQSLTQELLDLGGREILRKY